MLRDFTRHFDENRSVWLAGKEPYRRAPALASDRVADVIIIGGGFTGVSTAYHPDVGACAIFIYDGYPGGAGIVERGFRSGERLLRATFETVRQCPCARGCPSCVQSPKCGNLNEFLDKAGALLLLRRMLASQA